jgi:DNA repair photolyase
MTVEKRYCVDCYNSKICNRYESDVTQLACPAWVEKDKQTEGETGYDDFLDNESHTREKGGIEDGLRYEWWDIGMVRNAKDANKKKMKVFLDPAPHVILDQNVPLRGWYKSKYEPERVRARPCFTEALLTQPYGGSCPVRCVFCYVNNGIRGYRGQGITVVDPTYPEKVKAQLDKMKFGWNAYVSSFTEPFQKIEERYHNTERLSKYIVDYGLPLFYLTRQIPPDWAIQNLLKNKHSYQQYSIITNDRTDYKKMSPGAADLDDILKMITEQRKMGIYVSIQVNPIIAGIIENENVVGLIHELAKAGANHVIFKFVEIVSPSVPAMIRKMGKLFPDRVERFKSLFTENMGGMRTINEKYRVASLELFKRETQKAGITMGLCYEYGYDRDGKGNILNKTGTSLGREFCTGDQCHGQRSPLYVKVNDKFRPFKGCPPCGCLYCEETNPGGPPCKVDMLYKAPALGSADYNKSHWGYE